MVPTLFGEWYVILVSTLFSYHIILVYEMLPAEVLNVVAKGIILTVKSFNRKLLVLNALN